MGKKDPRCEWYIAKSAEFAKPILNHLRKLVHKGCPEVVEEMKWGMPHFSYKGMFCRMAAFKQHATFGFWHSGLLAARVKDMPRLGAQAMGNFGRLTTLDDLPSDAVLLTLLREAKRLKDEGMKSSKRKVTPKKDRVLTIPGYFLKAVRKNRKALATFEGGSYSFKKEYVAWVVEAKGEATRARRLETAVTWMAEGKNRNWKYGA